MAELKKMRLSVNHNILPPEMLVKILKLFNYKAQLICKKWNDIAAKLKKKVAGKILWPYLYSKLTNLQIIFIYREDFLHHCYGR